MTYKISNSINKIIIFMSLIINLKNDIQSINNCCPGMLPRWWLSGLTFLKR